MKHYAQTLISITLFAATSLPSFAIVLRHDVTPENYLATVKDFPPLAQFYVDGAHGTLIAPTWVVTAAHTTFCTDPGVTILVGGKHVKVKRRFVHRNYTPGVSHDFALLELEHPITHIQPAEIYKASDELGQVITFIGIGGTGNGIDGQTIDNAKNKGVLRKANNTVAKAEGPLLQFIFNQGNEALPLEGISGGGDSGGPAFLKKDERYYVLGISSRGDIDSMLGKYGNREYYSRISYFKDWIHNVMYGSEQLRDAITLPKLKHLLPGLTAKNLPQVCAEIRIEPEQPN
ncbi:trypsin-like serine protease [Pseudoalteromonas xiamenensis]|uniref:trypsin-like serine protease n=1 Tax=Pseudoalteromonas xiamenensis TaxID=882626 RepID=UPI0027E3BCEE|nr:trypsin-like serine protease [Pseudoalteromonas xiamenensis]WMN60881.1 trypsin-like serine protease [Pseudoalteromonas xiamenensis]